LISVFIAWWRLQVMSKGPEVLHSYKDGSQLVKLSLAALISLKPWPGQRLIVPERINKLSEDVGDNTLDFDRDFKLMKYNQDDVESPIYIIDGQHRIEVIKRYFTKKLSYTHAFVTATLYSLDSEADANALFRKINDVMVIDVEEDRTLEINKIVEDVEEAFGRQHIRPDRSRRPYLSSETVRTWVRFLFSSKRIGVSSENIIETLSDVNLAEFERCKKATKLPSEKCFATAFEKGFVLPWTTPEAWTIAFDAL